MFVFESSGWLLSCDFTLLSLFSSLGVGVGVAVAADCPVPSTFPPAVTTVVEDFLSFILTYYNIIIITY